MRFFRREKDTDALSHVRRFSWQINQEQPETLLGNGLAEHVNWEVEQENQGKRLYKDSHDQSLDIYRNGRPQGSILTHEPTDLAALDEITNDLEGSWKKVIQQLIQKRGANKVELAEIIKKPTPDKLEKLVREAQDDFKAKKVTRGGIVKEWFFRVTGRIDNHKYLLDMLPAGDKYTSVLTGGFSACIKAAMEHQSIAGLISECLEKLSDQTHKLFRVIKSAYRNEYIKSHIVKFYSTLFELLVKILKEWLSSTLGRLRHSFGTSFRNELQSSMDNLNYHIDELSSENHSLILNDLGKLIQASFVGHVQDSSQATSGGFQAVPLRLMQNAFHLHGSSSTFGQIPNQVTRSSSSQENTIGQPQEPESRTALSQEQSDMQSNPPRIYWTTQTVRERVSWMSEYAQKKGTAGLIEQSHYVSVDTQVYHRLLQWTTSISSEALWIEGPPTMCEPSQSTLTSAFLLAAFQKLRVPLISYFCCYDPVHYRSFSCAGELLKMVYALIYQLSTILPDHLPSELDVEDIPDLSAARIGRLKKNTQSLPDAISILRDMLALGPPLFACILDGLQVIDKEEEPPQYKALLGEFVEVLANAKPSHLRIVKIWLSTDGHSLTLQQAVNIGLIEAQITDHENENEPLRLRMIDVAGAS